jgi:hypothetical protein
MIALAVKPNKLFVSVSIISTRLAHRFSAVIALIIQFYTSRGFWCMYILPSIQSVAKFTVALVSILKPCAFIELRKRFNLITKTASFIHSNQYNRLTGICQP